MSLIQTAALFLYAAINLFAFVLMWWDKSRSRESGAERIPEGVLFFLAIFFGGLGIFFGMFAFRHKTRIWYFLIGIPFVALQNAIFVRAALEWLESWT